MIGRRCDAAGSRSYGRYLGVCLLLHFPLFVCVFFFFFFSLVCVCFVVFLLLVLLVATIEPVGL